VIVARESSSFDHGGDSARQSTRVDDDGTNYCTGVIAARESSSFGHEGDSARQSTRVDDDGTNSVTEKNTQVSSVVDSNTRVDGRPLRSAANKT
jgi:hypothetical protein